MSIVLITGNHPRHAYLVRQLVAEGLVTGWVREIRESFIPTPPRDICSSLQSLFVKHFDKRESAEHEFFGSDTTAPVATLDVKVEDLNKLPTKQFIDQRAASLVISYGCHKLDVNFLGSPKTTFWNTHGGLSPEYRGVTTHFWPSYFLEPQMTGMTLHETTEAIDGGNIVFQSAATMVAGDTLHKLASRTVHEFVTQLASKLQQLDLNTLPKGITQTSTGRLFKSADWRPEHLELVYSHYEDRIVDAVIAGELTGRVPTLITAL